LLLEKEIIIYPNPTFGYFEIHGMTEDYSIELYDSTGKSINNFSIQNSTMNMEGLPNGIYLLQFKTKEHSFFQKIIKQ